MRDLSGQRAISRVALLAAAATASFSSLMVVSSRASAQAAEAKPEDEMQVCSSAFEQAQRLRNETKYLAANQEVLKCANPKCGDALFQECTRLYTDLQSAIPTVVFSARDAVRGMDLFDVTVTLDGQQLTDQLDGKALPVDPGNHTFTFSAANFPKIERQAVIRAGEKFRQLNVIFGTPAAASTTATPSTAATPAPAPEPAARPRKVPVASYVLGGLGVVGLGGFVAFRLIGSSEYDQLKSDCAPTCPDSDVNKVKTKYTLSYVALGVGAAAAVAAVTVYLVQPREAAPSAALIVAPTANGLAAGVVGRF